jgi:hypothetical protein
MVKISLKHFLHNKYDLYKLKLLLWLAVETFRFVALYVLVSSAYLNPWQIWSLCLCSVVYRSQQNILLSTIHKLNVQCHFSPLTKTIPVFRREKTMQFECSRRLR